MHNTVATSEGKTAPAAIVTAISPAESSEGTRPRDPQTGPNSRQSPGLNSATRPPLTVPNSGTRPSDGSPDHQVHLPSSAGGYGSGHELWLPRRYYKWKSPLLMVTFFVLG